jgi:hypothetical protein
MSQIHHSLSIIIHLLFTDQDYDDPNKAVVLWFWRWFELKKRKQGLCLSKFLDVENKHEVYENTNMAYLQDGIVSAETIIGKCHVSHFENLLCQKVLDWKTRVWFQNTINPFLCI